MVEVSSELVQMAGLFAGLGVVYGGIRADLRRLHVQAEQTAVVMRKTRRRLSGHIRREEAFCTDLVAAAEARKRAHELCRRASDRPS